jgi:hypothetical protein
MFLVSKISLGRIFYFYAFLAPFRLKIINIEEVIKIKRIIIDLNKIGLYNLPGIIIDYNWLGLSTTLVLILVFI